MRDTVERDLAVADELGDMAAARIVELKGIIRSLLEIVDAEITTDHDKWLYEKEIAAARLVVADGQDTNTRGSASGTAE